MKSNPTVHAPETHVTNAGARSVRRSVLGAMGAAVAVSLALGTAQTMRADDDELAHRARNERCSNRTLRGDYGFAVGGTIFAGPNQLLLRGVAMKHFDGEGNVTQVDFTTRNGVPVSSDWRSATGTYEINADCTGRLELQPEDGSPLLRMRLVVVDQGRQIYTVVETAGTGSTGTRVR